MQLYRSIAASKMSAPLLVSAIYLAARLPGLFSLPTFLDERIMLSYSRQMERGLAGFLSGLTEGLSDAGKMLLVPSVDLVAFVANLPGIATGSGIPETADWLLYGRVTVLLAGLASALGCFYLASALRSPRAGLLAAIAYTALPYAQFYDRILLADPFLSATGVWVAVLSVRLVRGQRSHPLLLAMFVLLALAAKTLPALFFLALPAWTWIWFSGSGVGVKRSAARVAGSYGLLILTTAVVVLAAGPGNVWAALTKAVQDVGKRQLGGRTPSLFDAPSALAGHSVVLPEWSLSYITVAGLLLLAAAVLVAAIRRDRSILFLLASGAAFLLGYLCLPGWVTPRYLVPVTIFIAPVLGLVVDGAVEMLHQSWRSPARNADWRAAGRASAVLANLVVLAIFGMMLVTGLEFCLVSISAPYALPLPASDRDQYTEGWPSGYGHREAVEWIKSASRGVREPLLVGMYPNSNFEVGARAAGIETLLVPDVGWFGESWTATGADGTAFSQKLRSPGRTVYFLEERKAKDGIAEQHTVFNLVMEPIANFPKPGGASSVQLYRIVSTPDWVKSRTVTSLISLAKEGKMKVSAPAGADPGAFVHVKSFDIGGDTRDVLFMHPEASGSVAVSVPPAASLQFSMALDPAVWDKQGDGVDFTVRVQDEARSETLFSAYVDPIGNPEQRRWIDASVDLGKFAGEEVRIVLSTGSHDNLNFDWAGWGTPRIVLP